MCVCVYFQKKYLGFLLLARELPPRSMILNITELNTNSTISPSGKTHVWTITNNCSPPGHRTWVQPQKLSLTPPCIRLGMWEQFPSWFTDPWLLCPIVRFLLLSLQIWHDTCLSPLWLLTAGHSFREQSVNIYLSPDLLIPNLLSFPYKTPLRAFVYLRQKSHPVHIA